MRPESLEIITVACILFLVLLASLPTTVAESTVGPASLIMKVEPERPGAGDLARFAFRVLQDSGGRPASGVIAVTFVHTEDNIAIFSTEQPFKEGRFEFSYAFPDGVPYNVIVKGKLGNGASISKEFLVQVKPLDPPPTARGFTFLSLLLALAVGLLAGRMVASRRFRGERL